MSYFVAYLDEFGQIGRLIPLAQIRLYVVGAARGTGRRV
jgi:hypothetical protein